VQKSNQNIFKETISKHKYSTDHINMFISMVLAATGLSCATRIMNIIKSFFNLEIEIPSWYTGRLWLLKLGLYKLTEVKEIADDWIWIVDHSIQIGKEKCLVILGIRISKLQGNKILTLKDVEPIDLVPVKKSNGEVVYEQLQKATQKTGVPRSIVGDEGSDLKAGINKFIEDNKDTVYIYDIKHRIAVELKKELKDDNSWKNFIKFASTTQNSVKQTELYSRA
jgi:hypothetical protein